MLRRAEVKDSTYEPYTITTISIPLNKPLRSSVDGQDRDEIICIDGVYGVNRKIDVFTIDGNTPKGLGSKSIYLNISKDAIYKTEHKMPTNNSVAADILCDQYVVIPQNSYLDYGKAVMWSNGSDRLCFINENMTSLDDWNRALTDKPLQVQLVRNEPVFEPFDNQALFDNIVTYDNVTYITNPDNAEMWVEYYSNSSVGQRLAKTDEEMRAEHRQLQEQITNNKSDLQSQIEGVSQIASAAKNTAEDNVLAVTTLNKDMASVKDNQLVKSVYSDTMGFIKALMNGQILELTATSRTLAQLQTALTSLHNAGFSPNSYVTAACRYGTSESPNNIGCLEIKGSSYWLYDVMSGEVLTNADFKVTFNATWIVTEKSVG